MTAALLASPPVSFIVSYYGFLDARHFAARLDPTVPPADPAEVSPAAVVEGIPRVPATILRYECDFVPTLIVRAALDYPELNESIDRYVSVAHGRGDTRLEEHPAGHHAFDILDADERSRELIAMTLDFMDDRLRSDG